jgi:hypothetical protein
MIRSAIYTNLQKFKPQKGVVYKKKYEDILKNPQVLADAKKYLTQAGDNIYTHENNYYLAAIRHHVLTDNFFVFYFVRSNVKPIKHEFAVQMSANTDNDFELYKKGKCYRFLEMRARGHLKTKDNENLAVRCILTYPEESLLFVAFRRLSAERSMEAVKLVLEMDEIKHAFSDILYNNPNKETTWSLNKGLLVKRSVISKDLSVECCGFYEGSNTGGHYRFLFVDDIMTKDMRDSEKMIQLGKEHFDNLGNLSDFGNQDTQAMVRVTGTPYAWDDVVMYVDNKVYEDGTKMYKTRKIREANDEDVPIFVTQSEHEINKLSDNYRSQQQLDPSPLKIEGLNWDDIVITDYIPGDLMQFIVVDPAGDIKEFDTVDRDNWAIITLGAQMSRDHQGLFNIYIIDMVLRNMTEAEAPQQIANMYFRNRAVQSIAIEQSYSGYLATLVTNLIKQSTGIELTESDNSLIRLKGASRGNKKNNINKQLSYRMRNNKVHLFEGIADQYKLAFKKEVDTFPTGKRDDALDAIAYINHILEKLYFDYRVDQYSRRQANSKIRYMDDIKRDMKMRQVAGGNQYKYL